MTVIRPMRWWDIEPVVVLERELFEDAWSAELFWSELAQGDTRHYLVATDDEQIVGYAGAALYPPEGAVQTLAVAPAAQRRGLGRRLLADLLNEGRHRAVSEMTLEVRAGNVAAEALYRQFGFETVGLRRDYYEVSGADAHVMLVTGIDSDAYGEMLRRARAAPAA
ncbi:MAG: ribosomal protein S18-alanine N-acetyltransferase [Mycobacteriales bacterium]|nr:ribosomal protein S18-alanine N-acetyltransferase [Frankia sp.]